jgi:methyl-accepting chemotaxis protein
VIQESKTLEQITSAIENGMQEMASGAEQIDMAVNRVNRVVQKLQFLNKFR